MRFIHLADLHLGKRLHEYPLIEDQRALLDSVLELCRREKAQALVVAGDIYDKSIPSLEAIELLETFFVKISALDIHLLVIAGNHDSGERLAFGDLFFKSHKLHLSGVFKGRIDPLTLEGPEGPVSFYLLPYVRPSEVRPFFPDRELASVSDAVAAVLSTLDRGPGRQVLVSHQFVRARTSAPLRSDSEILQVGTADEIDESVYAGFDYVALGHLHGMQRVGSGPLYYAGSPLAYSFSEVGQTKGALVVDLPADGPPVVRQEALAVRHALRRIRGTLDELLAVGRGLEKAADPSRFDYLEVTLTDQGPVTDPMNRLKVFYPHVMRLVFERDLEGEGRPDALLDQEDLRSLSLADLFARFYQLQTGRELTGHLLDIVEEVAAEAEAGAGRP